VEIFLSYPSEHVEIARAIYEFLRWIGADVWFDKESLVAGQDWDRERLEAQRRADLTVLICSRETFEKPGVIQREVKQVLDLLNDKPLGRIYLICVRIEEIGFPPELARYQWVNYFEPDWKVKLARSLNLKFKELKLDVPDRVEQVLSNTNLLDIIPKSISHTTDILEASATFSNTTYPASIGII
jgi:TIR domain-containing protein